MRKARFCLIAIALLATACTSQWAMKTESSGTQVLWPALSEKPRVKYVQSINGFEQTGTSVKSLIFGKAESRLLQPVTAVSGSDGRIAVSDTQAACIHLFIPSEKKYLAITNAGSETLLSPTGLAFDEARSLYVADSALQKVFVFDRDGSYLFSFPGTAFKRPTGLAYNSAKKILYVVDTLACKIYAVDLYGEILFSFGERGEKPGQFNFPTHIFWSPSGLLYITDAMNFRVQIFDASGNFKTAFGRHGDGSGDFSMPKGVAVDKLGTIYVVDMLFDNVQLFNETGEFLLTIGSRGYGQGEFWLPNGIFVNDNKMYVSDTFNQRVQVFELLQDEYQ
jgi:DNA-binding beta-propeller fold protein YncE